MENYKEVFIPKETVSDDTVRIVELNSSSGSEVLKGEIVFSIETSKSVIEVESPISGFITHKLKLSESIPIGGLAAIISAKELPIKTVDRLYDCNNKIKSNKKSDNSSKTYKNFSKKALDLIDREGLNIIEFSDIPFVRVKDVEAFIEHEGQSTQIGRCLILDRKNKFIQYLLNDESFRDLSSEKKIEKYKANGHEIGKNVNISNGAILIGNKIKIKDNVSIGVNTYIESPEIHISSNTSIGNDCEFVASKIWIGKYNNISNKVYIDISGGRSPDSNFITGRGCLIAYETYINVCRQVEIGQNVALSPKSMIYTHSYWQSILDGYPATFGPVTIEDNSWVGSMAQILPNITVRTGSIIISNSLVIGDVKPFTMVGGVPATQIKEDLQKNISKANKEKIFKELFIELGDWLYSHHFDIEKINNKNMIVISDNEKKSCFLLGKQLVDNKDKFDIVITYDSNGIAPKYYKTLFDINSKTVIGTIETVEKMIIEFFRRRGIRFYGQ